MNSYREWIAAKKAEAISRGGKPLRNLPNWRLEHFRWSGTQADGVNRGFALSRNLRRETGEIINPITGEFVTGCLTISKLANAIGMTTSKLTDLLERVGLVHRVLAWKGVPMVTVPEFRKPQYFQTPAATRSAVEADLLIPVKMFLDGAVTEMILVTRRGQLLVEHEVSKQEMLDRQEMPENKVDSKRATIADLLRQGHSQAEIVRRTSLPKQTVSRHVRAMREAA